MDNFMRHLWFSLLVTTFALNQVQFATAACTNTTWMLSAAIDTYGGTRGGKEFVQKLDFISCPSSSNTSCEIPPKTYTITVSPQLNISNSKIFNTSYLEYGSEQDSSHILHIPLDSQDSKDIFANALEVWKPDVGGFRPIIMPVTFSITSQNISKSVNLSARPGYNKTLYYEPMNTISWAQFEGCDNKSLDGYAIEAVMPYYSTTGGAKDHHTHGLMGKFAIDEEYLDDYVHNDVNRGAGLNAEKSFIIAMITFGVLALNSL